MALAAARGHIRRRALGPVAFLWLWKSRDVALGWALIATALAVFAFRGLLDLIFRRFIPQPSLFALDDDQIREEDVLNRRRHWWPVAIGALLVSSGRAGVARERYSVRYPGNGVLYQLCGGGTNCLPAGQGSALEDPLLFRESIDLALNTFHYLPGADNVLIFLPSQRGVTPQDPRFDRAILFGRQVRISRASSRAPLQTIPPVRDITTGKLSVSDAGRFVDLTTDHLFHYDVQQSVNNLLIQLTPPAG